VTTSDLINSAGECSRTLTLLNADGTNSATTNSVKLSRSKVLVSWDGAGAGCPKNWWVCSKAERGTAACGATQATIPNFYIINCSAYTWLTASGTPLPAGVDLLTSTVDDGYAWLADPYNTAALNANGFNEGSAINQAGTLYAAADVDNVTVAGGSTRVLNQYGDLCYYRPVWCCSY
jgi:hypothetical protein